MLTAAVVLRSRFFPAIVSPFRTMQAVTTRRRDVELSVTHRPFQSASALHFLLWSHGKIMGCHYTHAPLGPARGIKEIMLPHFDRPKWLQFDLALMLMWIRHIIVTLPEKISLWEDQPRPLIELTAVGGKQTNYNSIRFKGNEKSIRPKWEGRWWLPHIYLVQLEVAVLMVFCECLWMIGLFYSLWAYCIRQSQLDKTVVALGRSPFYLMLEHA